MVGLLISSPIFAEASKHFNAFRLIGTGLGVWTLAVLGCGLSVGFVTLLLCRMAVGVGEASFVALASPFIDDNAPPDKKTRWLAVFYLCIPTGYALGYIYGGLGCAMLPFVVFCLRAPPIDIRGTHTKHASSHDHTTRPKQAQVKQAGPGDSYPPYSEQGLLAGDGSPAGAASHRHGDQEPPEQPRATQCHSQSHSEAGKGRFRAAVAAVWADLATLGRHSVYVLAVGGMTCYTAVLGTFAFYGPKAGRDVFEIEPEVADLAFGAITVLTGVFGTLAGGMLLDRMGSTLRNALLVCSLGTAAGFALLVLGFALAPSFGTFAIGLAAGEFAMFMTQAPSNAICMWSVPAGLRPFAMSMSVVAMHVLGDVPGPPLLGLLQGSLRNWRLSMSLCSAMLLVGAALYGLAGRAALTAVDYRELTPLESDAEEGETLGGDQQQQQQQHGQERPRLHQEGLMGGGAALGGGAGEQGHVQDAWRQQSGRLSPERPLLRDTHASSGSLDGGSL
ncbi:hypothetical protein N2152v2_007196 [Parachlorella kessleri]